MTSKHNRTGRSKSGQRHVRLYHWMMATAAWKSLDGVSRSIYIEIASRYAGTNNGRIPYSVREGAEALHISPATAARALERLKKRGFIVPTIRGAFSHKKRHATEWMLTEFPCDVTNADINLTKTENASKEFTRWEQSGPTAKLRSASGSGSHPDLQVPTTLVN